VGQPHGIGIVGAGYISGQYLDTLAGREGARIVAVADRDTERAAAVAARAGARPASVDELLADPEIGTVLNLTIPAAHAEVALAAIGAGKDVYGEKPLAATMTDAAAVLAAAERAGRSVGCAPDTVLGTGLQTARAAVDAGLIGRPVSASATWVSRGHEAWHPDPDFYYLPGGGPLLDMGPYYVTALVHLLGPVAAVSGAASRTRATRTIATGPRAGTEVPVEVDTHVTGILEHEGGAISTIVMSFDAGASSAAPIEVHGEDGSIGVPDPNTFDGEVRHHRGAGAWEVLPVSAGYVGAGRGVGLLDFVAAGAAGAVGQGGEAATPGRASGALALHVLDVMTSVLDAAHAGERRRIRSSVARPEAVPLTTRW
jgi:predicted dehydrogenase